MMNRKAVITLGCIIIFATYFLWSQGTYTYHPLVREHGHNQSRPAKLLTQGPFSTMPTPNRIYYKNNVAVLMYHDVSPNPTDEKSIDVNVFEHQIQLMRDNGFKWITMDQYVNFVVHHEPVPDNAVLMTFDDGYETFYQHVYPILNKYSIPATNFLIVSTIDNPKHVGIPKLSWEQIRQMHTSGIDFYNHTFDSHGYAPIAIEGKTKLRPALMGPLNDKKHNHIESEGDFKQRVHHDLAEAGNILREKLGNVNDVLAFPYGGYTDSLLSVSRELGIQVTFTVKKGINGPGQQNGYRVNAGGMYNIPEILIQYLKEGASSRGSSKIAHSGSVLDNSSIKDG
ncbi:polysaccharide deacetylase family protein [Paenibacillus sp. IHBB 10380]|uniref:polysaccharide deacetylase family protein n=1 Tax=Paenibacillus sp. IHBB 10380 TaxID=1566358 RepID=UPI0005CF9467|nr:polysaccharide deacetylase family protein [Paenibacillus sp. IHBB 10380]